jgi:transcriptional regulator with XRE-family HTH domain
VNEFGKAVRAAREARGWTQQDLALQAGVSQRAVSSWERGVSEPGDATKRAVANVLHLPPSLVPPQAAARTPSGSALLAELPLERLAPDEFENFAVTLAGNLYPEADSYRMGGSGHLQYGFDVVAERDGEVVAGIQCKRVQQFGPEDVHKAVAAAKIEVGDAYIFLSRAASPDARAAMRAYRSWRLWDKNKLSHVVHELSLDRAVPLVDRYFPLLRERFLGVPLPGPWLKPSEYFSRNGRSERASHRWALVGRDGILDQITAFAACSPGRVAMLVGRGGIGKTKLLHGLCERLAAGETNVRFLDRDPVIDYRAFEQLPAGRLLVVIDDAHDEDAPIGKVVAGVLAANRSATILLALRPDGQARSRRQLRETGLDIPDVMRWELDDLQLSAAEALAREVLGPDSSNAAPRLAAAARDCPFLLVTGALLIRDGMIDLHQFEGDDRLRQELIESLADTVPLRPADQAEARVEVLRAVAAFQPLRTADPDFRATLEELTRRPFDQLAPYLSAWEDAGILLSRQDKYRVVPDLLGDALLAAASRARKTGAPTGYLDRVRQAAQGGALANLIVNASRIDWQEPPVRRGQLVRSLWQGLDREFRAGGAATRTAALEVLGKVAFYQPQPTLAIVRWALENPAAPEQVPTGLGFSHTYTDDNVRDAAAPVLRAAAYHPSFLSQAADLLWELGRNDPRPPNQLPNHAMRMLGDMAKYDPRGVTIYQKSLPTIVERWLGRSPRADDIHNPLEALHPLLAAEEHSETWSPHALTLRPFLIDPDAPPVAELRQQVLALALKQLSSTDLRRAAAAAETVGKALIGPLDGFGLKVSDEQHAAWAKTFAQTLARLREAIQARPPGPAVSVALREQLQWQAEHPAAEIQKASREVLAMLPRRAEHDLARALHGGPIEPPADLAARTIYLDRHWANEQFLSDCAALIADWPDHEVIALIEQLVEDLRYALHDDSGNAGPFMQAIVTARPSLGEALCGRVQDAPATSLATLVAPTLSALAQTKNPRAVDLAQQLLMTADTNLARGIAHAFGLNRSRTNVLNGEPALLRNLIEHPDPDGIVPSAALGAVRYLATEHRELALEILTWIPEGRKDIAAGEIALAFGPHGPLEWADLAQRHKDSFLAAIRTASSLQRRYEVAEFLAALSLNEPHSVIDLLTARVEAVESGASARAALPHPWPVPLRFRDRNDFPDLLRRVREWLCAAPSSSWRRYLGSDLFSAVSGPFDAQVLQVIEEYLSEPDAAKIKTVSTMLSGAPRTLVWNPDFVRKCLRAADSCGTKSLAAVQSALHSALFAGGSSAAIGQPFPEDVEQRDNATKLAEQAVPGSLEEQFYRALSESAQAWINNAISEDDLDIDGRDW